MGGWGYKNFKTVDSFGPLTKKNICSFTADHIFIFSIALSMKTANKQILVPDLQEKVVKNLGL